MDFSNIKVMKIDEDGKVTNAAPKGKKIMDGIAGPSAKRVDPEVTEMIEKGKELALTKKAQMYKRQILEESLNKKIEKSRKKLIKIGNSDSFDEGKFIEQLHKFIILIV